MKIADVLKIAYFWAICQFLAHICCIPNWKLGNLSNESCSYSKIFPTVQSNATLTIWSQCERNTFWGKKIWLVGILYVILDIAWETFQSLLLLLLTVLCRICSDKRPRFFSWILWSYYERCLWSKVEYSLKNFLPKLIFRKRHLYKQCSGYLSYACNVIE